ncbi:very short patch repair endonuclease [Flavobacterium sp. Fl-77]|uniref:Very short patch repair endonuclease n=1 Tax=Flavobacterium flavipigmentatum TaxID=2893884 RepID=A0AAJ2VX48_9FLAO|nr:MULTISPECIES: very short patch repair endonuclease [unclassified Flavobacterium]MDX6181243.1 very short patch repair endonuclease [Flavobacterium sp. Fl-33]MDX6184844.1 very short patch repair endonuclease [Flavobacterium sp. Fl-77]
MKIKVLRFEEANGFYTTPERSKLMSKIKTKDTKSEILFRKELWKAGLRYRKHDKKLPGNPDIVSKKFKLIIFIDGEFWISKIERNIQRDHENNLKLEKLGYKVFRFWEHYVKKESQKYIQLIRSYLNDF